MAGPVHGRRAPTYAPTASAPPGWLTRREGLWFLVGERGASSRTGFRMQAAVPYVPASAASYTVEPARLPDVTRVETISAVASAWAAEVLAGRQARGRAVAPLGREVLARARADAERDMAAFTDESSGSPRSDPSSGAVR